MCFSFLSRIIPSSLFFSFLTFSLDPIVPILFLFLQCGFRVITTLDANNLFIDLIHFVDATFCCVTFMLYFHGKFVQIVYLFAFFDLGSRILSVGSNSHHTFSFHTDTKSALVDHQITLTVFNTVF